MRYIYLKSSDSLDIYPDNVLSDFCVKLPEAIELEGSWEVALAEIQYPSSWEKHPYSLWVKYSVSCHFVKENERIPFHEKIELTLTRTKNADIIKRLMDDFNRESNFLVMSRDSSTRRITISAKSDNTICHYVKNKCADLEMWNFDEDEEEDRVCEQARATLTNFIM